MGGRKGDDASASCLHWFWSNGEGCEPATPLAQEGTFALRCTLPPYALTCCGQIQLGRECHVAQLTPQRLQVAILQRHDGAAARLVTHVLCDVPVTGEGGGTHFLRGEGRYGRAWAQRENSFISRCTVAAAA